MVWETISFKCTKYLKKNMDKLAEKMGISRSELIRRAIIKYLIAHGECRELTYWIVVGEPEDERI